MSVVSAFAVPHPPLIIPEIGRGQELKIKKTIQSYERIGKKISEIRPDTIVVTTPHSILYSDYIHISPGLKAKGDFRAFGEDGVKLDVEYDDEFVEKLSELCGEDKFPAGTLGEKNKALDHGIMIPLYFVNKYYNNYKTVRISISGLSFIEHYEFGKKINMISEKLKRKTVIIASGDLSHTLKDEGPYGYTEEGPIFDEKVTEVFKSGNFMNLLTLDEQFCEIAGECGLRSFIIMAGALDGKSVQSELLSYEGPYGVGYAAAEFLVGGDDPKRHFDLIYKKNEQNRIAKVRAKEDAYISLARCTLEEYILNGSVAKHKILPKEMTDKKAGVFVSLKLDGQLRGCIGTISPTTDCIADEIMQNAISAGLEDPRFAPVSKRELSSLVYSVDILKEAEPVESKDELNPEKYGVIVTSGRKRGLLLPNLEGVNTVEEQINIALKKAGIGPNEKYNLEKFEVIRHK